jgi:hypothetical protein
VFAVASEHSLGLAKEPDLGRRDREQKKMRRSTVVRHSTSSHGNAGQMRSVRKTRSAWSITTTN